MGEKSAESEGKLLNESDCAGEEGEVEMGTRLPRVRRGRGGTVITGREEEG